jgi:hypothetical protein
MHRIFNSSGSGQHAGDADACATKQGVDRTMWALMDDRALALGCLVDVNDEQHRRTFQKLSVSGICGLLLSSVRRKTLEEGRTL